jgi:outer membrane usher protein FimD/PapC
MKHAILSIVLSLALAVACMASATVPTLNVTVADSSGKTAYKGATDSRGIFASPKMQPGNYAVQFTSNSATKGSHYTLVVVAGTKKTSASAITAEKLAAGGVAMKIEVKANASIQGQVSPDMAETRIGKNGKLMVWIPKKVGSNLPAHWAESDSAEAKEVEASYSYSIKNMQNKVNQGVSPLNGGGKMGGGATGP